MRQPHGVPNFCGGVVVDDFCGYARIDVEVGACCQKTLCGGSDVEVVWFLSMAFIF